MLRGAVAKNFLTGKVSEQADCEQNSNGKLPAEQKNGDCGFRSGPYLSL
jgi:hypothetical protein